MWTHENKFIALSRLSNVAMASTHNVSMIVTVNVHSLTYDMIIVLLYTELDSCPGVSMLSYHYTVSTLVARSWIAYRSSYS